MANVSAPFSSAKSKVNRAKHHIDELQVVVNTFSALDSYEIVMALDQAGERWPFILPIKPIPDNLPLIIGDVIHNLRSALDHVATEIASRNGEHGRHIMFPFHEKRKQLVTDAIKITPIEMALSGAKRLILDEIQPCSDGNGYMLYAMHTLDVRDKHKQIIIITNFILTGRMVIRVNGEVRLAARSLKFNPDQTTQIAVGPWCDQAQIEHDYKSSLEICFGEPDAFRGKAVLSILLDLTENVSNIISRFEELLG